MNSNPIPPKPVSERIRPELTRLPPLTPLRRIFRRFLRALARLAVRLLVRADVRGLEHVPLDGPVLMVINHLGDSDPVVALAALPRFGDTLAKIELFDLPLVGRVMDAYGVIWVHRGHPDRRAIRAALQGLAEDRLMAIAPEGRESLTGALEEGTQGAAYLALKAGVPVLPVTFTGTENARIYGNLKRLRRTPVSMTVGRPYRLQVNGNRQEAIARATQEIMLSLARQLPSQYQGNYRVD